MREAAEQAPLYEKCLEWQFAIADRCGGLVATGPVLSWGAAPLYKSFDRAPQL
jgi:hypothetical protein